MPKTLEEKLVDRLKEIAEARADFEKARDRLMELTGLTSKDKKIADSLPENFQLQEALLQILRENGGKLNVSQLADAVKKKHDFYPDKKVVQSSIGFAEKKGLVEKTGQGRGNVFYSVPQA